MCNIKMFKMRKFNIVDCNEKQVQSDKSAQPNNEAKKSVTGKTCNMKIKQKEYWMKKV